MLTAPKCIFGGVYIGTYISGQLLMIYYSTDVGDVADELVSCKL